MIRGKYLRERKAIRTKKRLRFMLTILVLFLAYKVLFNSYSLYESQAESDAQVDVAFFILKDEYQTKTIALNKMLPGDPAQSISFSIANYETVDGESHITETDMEYTLKIRTTTNLPLTYRLYKVNESNTTNKIEELQVVQDVNNTYFYKLYEETGEFDYGIEQMNTYRLEIEFPGTYKDVKYSNIIEAIEISVEGKQVID